MNPHRQHYFEANRPAARERAVGGVEILAILLVIITAVGAASAHLARAYGATGPEVLRAPLQTELPPLNLQEARLEGFRAGYSAATEQNCRPALSSPIASR